MSRFPATFKLNRGSVEPGEEFKAVWGTGYETGRAYIELEHRGNIINAFWTQPNETQTLIKHAITERMRGGFSISVCYIRENRAYIEKRQVDVPWTNKNLTVKWDHFVSKLQPGGRETWTATVSGPDAKQRAAEMVAALYDASLDAFVTHYWQSTFGLFYRDNSQRYFQFQNGPALPAGVYPQSSAIVQRCLHRLPILSPGNRWCQLGQLVVSQVVLAGTRRRWRSYRGIGNRRRRADVIRFGRRSERACIGFARRCIPINGQVSIRIGTQLVRRRDP